MRRRRLTHPLAYTDLPARCCNPIRLRTRRTEHLVSRPCRSRSCSRECFDAFNFRKAEVVIESLAQGRQPAAYLVIRPTPGTRFDAFMEALKRFSERVKRVHHSYQWLRVIHLTENIDPHANLVLLDRDTGFLREVLAEDAIAQHLRLEYEAEITDPFALVAYLLRVIRDPDKKTCPPSWAAKYRLVSFSRGFLNGRVEDLRRAARERRYGERAYHLRKSGGGRTPDSHLT